MRMWNVTPAKMCNMHLRGEHVEMHMFLGSIRKRRKLSGYITKGFFDSKKLKERHDLVAAEMLRRGDNHITPLELTASDRAYLATLPNQPIASEQQSKKLLNERCTRCSRMGETKHEQEKPSQDRQAQERDRTDTQRN